MATPIPKNRAAFTLEEVARATGGVLKHGDAARAIAGVAIDSRAVDPGNLFVAIRGAHQDGARYLPQALAQGAAAALVPPGTACPDELAIIEVADTTRALGDLAAFHRRRWARPVVAITGSAGKTTTKELTAQALRGLGIPLLKTSGNLNNLYGVPMVVFGLGPEHELAVLEVGTSRPGEIARLGEIVAPDVGVVTLAAAAHTEGLGDVDAVADEKASLWSTLRDGGSVVVNADDPRLAARAAGFAKRLSFGTQPTADVRLLRSALSAEGTTFSINAPDGQERAFTLSLLGHVAALDACAALACVIALRGGGALEAAGRALLEVKPTPGRMALRQGAGGLRIVDDTYNANPVSVQRSLESLVELAGNLGARSVAVLADMRELGPASRREHAEIGRHAVRLHLDLLVTCGPEMAVAAVEASRLAAGRLAPHPTRVAHVLEVADAVRLVKGLVRPGDVVLVKGSRSMGMERVVDALCLPRGGPA